MASSLARRWKLGEKRYNTADFDVSRDGDLVIRVGAKEVSVPKLAERYGSPLELFFPDILKERVRAVIQGFDKHIRKERYAGTFTYHYPMKVNQRKEFVLAALAAGASIETSSANELALLHSLRIKKSLRILCNGPKTDEYMSLVGKMHREGYAITPIIEDEHELAALARYPGPVGIRADLSVKIHSHWDKQFNRFGFREDDLRALPPIPNLSLLSYHLSSQIESEESFARPIRQAIRLFADLKAKNPKLHTLNIGGGAGVPYIKEPFYTTDELIGTIVRAAKAEAKRVRIPEPDLICEWGRHVAAPAQMTVFKIIGAKSVAKGLDRRWYVIDGSFIANLPDTWSLHQRWHVIPANRMNVRASVPVWLAGSSCDSDDEYIPASGEHISMPPLRADEDLYVAVLDTGAYQDSLASYHCLLSHPARISVSRAGIKRISSKQSALAVAHSFGW
jgi:arginine decarboxylase